jgi:hypothetical protein
MPRFELSKGVRDPDSILNEYRPKKRRGTQTESDSAEYLNLDAVATPIDEQSTRHPVEGDNIEGSDANGLYPAPFSFPMNSSTVSLRGHDDKPRHSRLDEIADALRTLTYGEMLELAESMWKINSQGSDITESDLPNLLYRWSKSRDIEN